VLDTVTRIHRNLASEDFLAANRLLLEGVLRPDAARTLALEAIAKGRPAPVSTDDDLAMFEDALRASPYPGHRQLGVQVARTARNADAHARAHQLITGKVQLATRDGIEEVEPVSLEITYWQLRSMIDGLDTALETALVLEVARHDPPQRPVITTVAQSEAVMARLLRPFKLRLVQLAHHDTTLTAEVRGDGTDNLDQLAAGVLRVYGGQVAELVVVNPGADWVYHYRPNDAIKGAAPGL
jgi:hypothetical protein